MRINELAERAYLCALRRGKITEDIDHKSIVTGLAEEFAEFVVASECLPSEHLPFITEANEELVDIMIVCLTEMERRGLDAELLLTRKMEFNEQRD